MAVDRNRPSPCPHCGRSNPWFYRTCSLCKASLVGISRGPTTSSKRGQPSWGDELLARARAVPSVECVHCGNGQPARLAYCRRCGRSTRSREEHASRHCGACRAFTPDGDLFCLDCGAPTRPGETAPDDGFRDEDCARCLSPADATVGAFCGGCGGPLSAARHEMAEVVHALRAILAKGRGYRDQAASLEPLPGRIGGVHHAEGGVEISLELLPSERGKLDLELLATGAPPPFEAARWSLLAVALRLLAPSRIADGELSAWVTRRAADGERLLRAERDGNDIRVRLTFRSLPEASQIADWLEAMVELHRARPSAEDEQAEP